MKVTIIVPSLDPDEKLLQVVEGLLAEGFRDILLVNDGSHADHLQPFLDAARHPEVTVLTHGAAFDYVSTSKGKGYIRNTHLTTKKPDGKIAFIRNPANRTVNLRSGPGTGYKVIAEYRPGTKVNLLKYGSSWCKVSVGGKTGYIMTKYIRTE